MPQDFGSGVSRTLTASDRQFSQVVWQFDKPPLDSELNLMGQIDSESVRESIRSCSHSGFLIDPSSAESDFVTSVEWSNWFRLGRQAAGSTSPVMWANVNGWVIPVVGTGVPNGDTSNRVNLFPPPSTDSRVDLVFLEVWQAQIAPNPSVVNKPSASSIFKHGNTLFGGTNLPDDLEDPAVGFETTERVQVQYRLRVFGKGTGLGDSVDLAQYPDGLDDPNIVARGAKTGPVAGYVFSNMGQTLGDKGLWRAGSGDAQSRSDLGTVDGHVYAIPVCAVFRRNSGLFVALSNSGNANQNGSFNRNPTSGAITDPLQSSRTFSPVVLATSIAPGVTGLVSVSGLSGSGFDNSNINWGATVLKIGEEMVTVSAFNSAGGTMTLTSRGRFGTQAVHHQAGDRVEFYTFRPDGRFSDEVHPTDILDLRRSVTLGQWSFDSVLRHNLGKILDGTLRSSYKQGNGSDTQGTQVIEVGTYLGRLSGTLPNQTERLDGFDGIRTVFSDSAVVQNDVSLLLSPSGSGVIVSSSSWGVAPDFNISGFIPSGSSQWEDGTIVRLFLGGSTGTSGARSTSQSGDRFMRFVSPKEYWLSRDAILPGGPNPGNQTPFLLRFVGNAVTPPYSWSLPAGAGEASGSHPGPMFPLPDQNFLTPYAVLGGVVNNSLAYASALTVVPGEVHLTGSGVNFNAPGQWVSDPLNPRTLSTAGISNTLLYGKRNLFDMLTSGGKDLTGASSELFLVLQDSVNPTNRGLFRVVGAGTIGYTSNNSSSVDGLVLSPIGNSTLAVNGAVVSVEVRSLYMNTEDGPGSSLASVVLVVTDLAATSGGSANPWNALSSSSLDGDMVLDVSVLYGPSRGARARLPDELLRFTIENPVGAQLLREAPENKDPSPLDITTRTGAPEDEYYFPSQPVQAWNRLPSLGMHAPRAPGYGEGRYNFETRRESELFSDLGSKTVVFRPFRQVLMSLPSRTTTGNQIPSFYDDGVTPIDGANLFPSKDLVFDVPPEHMVRFGRQDIPFRSNPASGGPYFGVNHLFSDTPSIGDNTLNIVGGTSTNTSMLVVTGVSSGLTYGQYDAGNTWYQGRLYSDVNSRSSDINRVLRGIQLPPYLGIARVYGVYDKRDYDVNGSAWLDRGFTPDTGVAKGTNLLRTNSDKQTLFIVKDGANDVVAGKDAHTYLVPEDLVDVTLSPDYLPGETFEDLEYVVEVAVFGFAQGFVNRNNYVLSRTNLPDGLYTGVRMVVPTAMPIGVRGYSAYLRTVYQGDPYMTRGVTSLQAADYENRYGSVPVAGAFAVGTPVQQYDLSNTQIPQIPNPRALEVLVSADFWTTLGTGKVSGPVYPGTVLDAGFLESSGSRVPSGNSANPFQPVARAFTEGQPEDGNFASLQVLILDNSALLGEVVQFQHLGDLTTLTAVAGVPGSGQFQVGSDSSVSARNLANAVNSDNVISVKMQTKAFPVGNSVLLQSTAPGLEGRNTFVSIGDPSVLTLVCPGILGPPRTRSNFLGGENVPMNGSRVPSAVTPVRLSGMTDRLPLGILVNDSDFVGEDPRRNGNSYGVSSGGQLYTESVSTFRPDGVSHLRSGPIGMADGSILQYTAYNAVSAPDGTRRFRVYRGGGAAYFISEGEGVPLDFSAGGFEPDSTMKGAVLAGRAYLVRNQREEAFGGTSIRSHGDELQVVLVTSAIYGEGARCEEGYALSGTISPSDYGRGYMASDRYRLEGKPLMKSNAALPDPSVPLVPYPPEDPSDDDPCA